MMGMDMTMLAKLLKGGVGSAQQGVRQMGNVFNPQAGLGGGAPVDPNGLFAQQGGGGPKDLRRSSAPQPVTPEKTPWMEQTALGGFSRGDLLLAGMGMLSGKNFKEGLGNASGVAFDALGRQREQSEKQKQSAALLKYMTANGKMAPEAAAALIDAVGPEAAIGQMSDAEGFTLGPNQARYDAAGNLIVDNPVADKPPTAMSALGKLRSDLKAGFITPEDYEIGLAELQRSGVNVSVNTGGIGAQSLSQIPVGQPVPEDLLGGIKLPEDTYAVRADNPAGFEFATIPGSASARKAVSGEQAKGGRTYTLGSLIGSYSTLAKNNAITARGNSTLENAAALYSSTGLGQIQDRLGGEVGKLANAEARDTIQGLSMKALMDMISMSEVSAKAMDSDAEMKAWLSAIKSDNYESALTKLHVLDLSFGSGQELQRAYEDGTIDIDTYRYVTNRVNSDPMVKQMLDKADRYAALTEAVGSSNLTSGERGSMQDLAGLLAPDGLPVTEDDIQETMSATGMTREQIIAKLRGQ